MTKEKGGAGSERLITSGSRAGVCRSIRLKGTFQFFSEPNAGAPMGWTVVYTAIVQNTAPIVAGATTVAVTTLPIPDARCRLSYCRFRLPFSATSPDTNNRHVRFLHGNDAYSASRGG